MGRARVKRLGTLRPAILVLAAVPLLSAAASGALLKKGAMFLPFGLQAIDGTNVIVKLEEGRLTLIREIGTTGQVKTHPAAVVVDFWATWCIPCRAGMPTMQGIHDRYKPKDGQADGGLNLFGIALDLDGSKVVKPFFDRLKKFTYSMLADPIPGLSDQGILKTAQDMKGPYGAEEIPVVYVIDSSGRIAYAHMGFDKNKAADLEKAVQAAVSGTVK
jgi:thiol-disulfide isomerase/thioredoxin